MDKLVTLGAGYRYSPDGTLYFVQGKVGKDGADYEESAAIANHTPLLQEQRVTDNRIETTEELIFRVLRAGRESAPVAVTLRDILSQTPRQNLGQPAGFS